LAATLGRCGNCRFHMTSTARREYFGVSSGKAVDRISEPRVTTYLSQRKPTNATCPGLPALIIRTDRGTAIWWIAGDINTKRTHSSQRDQNPSGVLPPSHPLATANQKKRVCCHWGSSFCANFVFFTYFKENTLSRNISVSVFITNNFSPDKAETYHRSDISWLCKQKWVRARRLADGVFWSCFRCQTPQSPRASWSSSLTWLRFRTAALEQALNVKSASHKTLAGS